MRFKKVFLIILDGFGLAGRSKGNAILEGGMSYLDSLIAEYPAFVIASSSLVVGLPWGNQGNSEVGHSAIGMGRILIQDLARINKDIRGGDFFKNPVLLKAFEHAKKNNSVLHFVGCVSPGGIHSHEDHLITLLEFARKEGVSNLSVHMFTDGRDASAHDGINSWKKIKPAVKRTGAVVSSVSGRMYSMDRILNWALTETVWKAMTGTASQKFDDVGKYLEESYKKGKDDYDLEPAVAQNGHFVRDNDAVFFFHFRNDRIIQLASPFVYADFREFNREKLKNVYVATMTKYKDDFDVDVAYLPLEVQNTLGEIISSKRMKQWRIAEKEKEAHVTNFFNGGRLEPWPKEERFIASSRMMKGDEYLEHPEMSAETIVKKVLEVKDDDASLYVINFANPDMIAHTGDLKATVKAIQITDLSLKHLIPKITASPENAVIITADHGNAEELIDPETGEKDTQHSTRDVPAIFIGQGLELAESVRRNLESLAKEPPLGSVVDIAPTILGFLGIEKPKEMMGGSLIAL